MIQVFENAISYEKKVCLDKSIFFSEKDFLNILCEAGVSYIACGKMEETGFGDEWEKSAKAKDVRDEKNRLECSLTLDVQDYKEDFLMNYDCKDFSAIQLIFRKGQLEAHEKVVSGLKKSGYKIFLCPKDSLSYSDMEWLEMLDIANGLSPDALYIFDESGTALYRDNTCLRLAALMDKHFGKEVMLGIHIRDTFSESFSVLNELCSRYTKRNIVIDTTILGVGEGKGFPNTELIMDNMDLPYNEAAMLKAMDVVWRLKGTSFAWGYSPLSYISAKTRTDIDYLQFFYYQGLHLDEIMKVVFLMEEEKRKYDFDLNYAIQILESWEKRITYVTSL